MKTSKKILIALFLNLFFSVLELVGGIVTGSVAILSDAVHDFGDAASIGLSVLFEKKSKRQPDDTYTYGYARYSLLGGAITTAILIVGSGLVMYNGVYRLFHPTAIDYDGMLLLAGVGLTVNLIATYFTHGGHSLNQKAVNLHMLEDALGWLVILIGAIVMRFTNFALLDPILSILVALFVLFAALKNGKEILDVFLLKKPTNIDVAALKTRLTQIDGVTDVHHIHVWSIDGENAYATLHVATTTYDAAIKTAVKHALHECGVCHATVEMEQSGEPCTEKECVTASHAHSCHHGHHHKSACQHGHHEHHKNCHEHSEGSCQH